MLTSNDIQTAYEAGPEAVAVLIAELHSKVQQQAQHIASLESALQVIAAQQDKLGRYEQQFAALSAVLQQQMVNASAPAPIAIALPGAGPSPLPHALKRGWNQPLLPAQRFGHISLVRIATLEAVLFAVALIVYAVTRLVALNQFPIYFHGDEAIETVLARELIARGFRDNQGALLPIFFDVANFKVGLITVYVHAISYALFGASVTVARATSALVTLTAVVAAALICKWFLKVRLWWAVVLFLCVTPAWFVHSRTAFETAMMTSFYTWFMLFYLLYRYRSPKFIWPAVVFAALTFYAYGNGQTLIGATGVLLLMLDLRYHVQQWRTHLITVPLLVLLAAPFIGFRINSPSAITDQLARVDSKWPTALPLADKLSLFFAGYVANLSPTYWFNLGVQDNIRHLMKGYGHMLLITLPLWVIGVALCLRQFKSSAHRAVLVGMLAAPVGVALTSPYVPRSLPFVVPACMCITLGADWLLMRWLSNARLRQVAATVLCGALSLTSLNMLRDALANGPLWHTDYGIAGMQWGTEQVFPALQQHLRENPNDTVLLSPTWTFNVGHFVRFYMPESAPRILVASIDGYLLNKLALDNTRLFVMTAEERQRAQASGKFKLMTILKTIQYPDGREGFYFAKLAYAENVDSVLAAEVAARNQPITETVAVNNEIWTVAHSQLDMGQIGNAFDGNPDTLMRGLQANPLLIDIAFPTPRAITGIEMTFAAMDMELTANLYMAGSDKPITLQRKAVGLGGTPFVQWPFQNVPGNVTRLQLLVRDINQTNLANIHVREVLVK